MDDTHTTTTDTAAPSTPSAPSGETTVASPSTPSKPTSFKEALAQTADKHAAPQGTDTIDPAARQEALATKRGPIPFDVHETTLRNAREKSAAERDAEWTNRVGWAANVNRERAEQALQLADLIDRDPIAFLDRAAAHLASDPQQAAQLRSALGRHLAAGRQAPAHVDPPLPTIKLEDGQEIDLNAFRDSIRRDTLQAASQQFQPAMDAAKELQQAKDYAVQLNQAKDFATGFMGKLTQLPQFKEHATEIRAELAKLRLETDHPAEVRAATLDIYNRIVLPKLQQAGSASLMASLKQKAVAQTETPSRSATAPSARPKNPRELAAFMAQRAAERG